MGQKTFFAYQDKVGKDSYRKQLARAVIFLALIQIKMLSEKKIKGYSRPRGCIPKLSIVG